MTPSDQTPEAVKPAQFSRRKALLGLGWLGANAAAIGGLYAVQRGHKAPVVAAAPALKSWPTLDALGEQMVAARLTPGLSLSVMHDGVLFYSRGFGVAQLDEALPVTPQTGFRIASITKHFTAAAILLLAEDGLLSLDDPLSRFLPEFPRSDEITPRQMLSHTAGLGDYINGQSQALLNAAQTRDYTSDELLAVMQSRKPLFRHAPGVTWAYSNSGFSLLGIVAERLSGLSLADFVQTRLAGPVGLAHTAIDRSCHTLSGCAGYRPNYRAPGGFDPIRAISPSFSAGAGAIRSTTEDLCRWQMALMNGRVVKPDSVTAMLTPALLKDGTPAIEKRGRRKAQPGAVVQDDVYYGLGLALGHDGPVRFAAHGGRINGFTGHLRSFPDQKLTVAILYNSDGGGAPGFRAAQRGLRTQATTLAMQEIGIVLPTAPSPDGAG